MKKVLFICTHNSARSQMAEGLLNAFHGDKYKAYSCGIEKTFVKQPAIDALADIGIDIRHHNSETMEDYAEMSFDFVITICDSAREKCPLYLGGSKVIHKSFRDPSNATGSDADKLAAFCRIRDEITIWLDDFFGSQ